MGTRSSELKWLAFDHRLIDLDARSFYKLADVADYVEAVLLAAADPASKSPYRANVKSARSVANVVAERARGSFLIARVAARTLARIGVLSSAEIDQAAQLWNAVGTAFDQDLARYGPEQERVRDLLLPLAFARGAGLPWETLWAPLASALSDGFTYDDADVQWLQDQAGAYIVEASEDGRAAYRLVHQELAGHLRRGHDASLVQNQIVATLLDRVPTTASGRRDWFAAHPYIRRHLATHAAAARRIDELLSDPGFMLAANQNRLTRAAWQTDTERGAAAAAVHLLAVENLRGATPAEGAAALSLAALLRRQQELADASEALFDEVPWRALWADWIPSGSVADRYTAA